MRDAARIAYRELVLWLVAEYGFGKLEAYMLLSQAGRVRLGNVVDPKYTLGASISQAVPQLEFDRPHQLKSLVVEGLISWFGLWWRAKRPRRSYPASRFLAASRGVGVKLPATTCGGR